MAELTQAMRHASILQRLAEEGEVLVEDLAPRFGVNTVTVRRDLAALERRGLIHRTHGGAILSRGGKIEFAFQTRGQARAAEKEAIGQVVADLLQPGLSVCLDTGTTTLAVARHLRRIPRLRVVTSSLVIAAVLYPCDNIELVILGGVVRKGSPDLFGMLTEENIRRFNLDVAVIGADAATHQGVFTTDVGISRVSQSMLAAAAKVILAIDSSKFEARAFVQFASWTDIDHVVTDDAAPAGARQWLEKVVGTVTYVPVRSADALRASKSIPGDRP